MSLNPNLKERGGTLHPQPLNGGQSEGFIISFFRVRDKQSRNRVKGRGCRKRNRGRSEQPVVPTAFPRAVGVQGQGPGRP